MQGKPVGGVCTAEVKMTFVGGVVVKKLANVEKFLAREAGLIPNGKISYGLKLVSLKKNVMVVTFLADYAKAQALKVEE